MEKFLLYLFLLQVVLLATAGIAAAIYSMVKTRTGDCAIQWQDEESLKINRLEFTGPGEAVVEFSLPVKSVGKQQCIIIDLTGRIHPEGDKFNQVDSLFYLYPSDNRRMDHYWEATLIKPGDSLVVEGEARFISRDRPIKEVFAEWGNFKVDLFYKYYCRSVMDYERKVINIDLGKVMEVKEPGSMDPRTEDNGSSVLPIRTPLLVPGDDLYTVFEKYARPHVRENDVLAVCESALAIMEGRAYYCEEIKPGFLATRLNRFFKMDSSLSSPYSLEMAIREVGASRILFSMVMGALGKVVGRDGDFYLYAGRAVATIDDCTGTLPPFDKYVVMGPENPKATAAEFVKKTGVKLAVVDVNNLGRVDVLALSDPEDRERVVEGLKTNPQGNANEQTPIALIRQK